jgi:hypothetical protein
MFWNLIRVKTNRVSLALPPPFCSLHQKICKKNIPKEMKNVCVWYKINNPNLINEPEKNAAGKTKLLFDILLEFIWNSLEVRWLWKLVLVLLIGNFPENAEKFAKFISQTINVTPSIHFVYFEWIWWVIEQRKRESKGKSKLFRTPQMFPSLTWTAQWTSFNQQSN